MSTHAATAEYEAISVPPEPAESPPQVLTPRQRPGGTMAATLALAGGLCFVTFLAGGGLHLSSMTTLELTLTLAAGAVVAGVVVLSPPGTRAYGSWSAGLLLAFTALTGLSVVWSVAPDASWQDAGRMLAYSGVFAGSIAVVWIAPGGWRALLGGIVLAAAAVCIYALLTKVIPDRLDPTDVYARLHAPYGYWNAIGLTAAMGAIGCLWLGGRRAGHALLTALSYPAMGLTIVTLMLAYSRGALVALGIGTIAWMALVPLRLRGARVLIAGALGAAPVVAWDFSRHALSSERVALAARTTAGHQLGVLLAAMVIVLTLAGIAIGFFGDRRAGRVGSGSGTRNAAGITLGALIVLAVIALCTGLALSKRGFTGTISHDLSSLTDPNAKVPNTPGRLTAVSSVRARYWKEALEIFEAHPALGSGAAGYETARLRYRTVPIDVRQAHGYVVQTLADLGIVGATLSLALLIVWMAAAGRSTHPFNRRWHARRSPPAIGWGSAPAAYTPERVGLLTMLCIVVVFGAHSFADWTWYVPGNACVALLCAGWLAGRGPLKTGNLAAPAGSPAAELPLDGASENAATATVVTDDPRSSRQSRGLRFPAPGELSPLRIGIAAAVVTGALLAAWTEWQPQRSVAASEEAFVLLKRNPVGALSAAQAGVERDPLSASALFRLAAIQNTTGQSALARATLQKAVRLQPSNPETWAALGEYDMSTNPRSAVEELRAAVYLNPQSVPIQNAYVEALRKTGTATTAGRGANASRATPAQKRLRRPLANSTRRAPGKPPAATTSTSSKPKSA
ncbi:MAG: O-antigen ligase family protein [Solirubrobacteraceae bacterium]